MKDVAAFTADRTVKCFRWQVTQINFSCFRYYSNSHFLIKKRLVIHIICFHGKALVTQACATTQGCRFTEALPRSLVQPSCFALSPSAGSPGRIPGPFPSPGACPASCGLLLLLHPISASPCSISCQSLSCQWCCFQQCQFNKEKTNSLMVASRWSEAEAE